MDTVANAEPTNMSPRLDIQSRHFPPQDHCYSWFRI
jgi:hypothetical protein